MFNWRKPLIDFYEARVRHRPILCHIASLNNFYSLPVNEQQRIQEERLEKLLLHAAQKVPYYRETFGAFGIYNNNSIDLARFRETPILSKGILRSRFDQLKSSDLDSRAWYKNSSGGSTGEPVIFLQDSPYYDLGEATTRLHYEWVGKPIGKPHIKLWGSDRDILQATVGTRTKLDNFVRNLTPLNSFRLGQDDMIHYISIIQKKRPTLIEAYAESIYELARYINKSNIQIGGVKSIVTSAGTLYPFMREEIQKAFHCLVYNRYGSREVGNMAAEGISQKGLRVFTYTHLIEVVNDQGEPCEVGEEGDLVVTCLTNYAMPLIRYQIGDRAIVKEWMGGRIFSAYSLENVTGRFTNSFVREDGSTVPAAFFIHFLGVVYNTGWLKKTQIIQQDYNTIRIKMVASSVPPDGILNKIETSIREVMGEGVTVGFDFVEDIPPLPSGKYSYTLSHVRRV
jgi:phenylacetate-CoA ligase